MLRARCFAIDTCDDARRMKLAVAVAVFTLAIPSARTQDPGVGAPLAATPTQALDPSLLAGLKARSIGPATTSGRIGAVCGVSGDAKIVWVGAASGGVWKSTDGGVRFEPVFDEQDCTSIGAIAIDARSPDVVWVGTGEGNPRNSASVGRGLYRTRDGGRTWQKLGLELTEHIHRILLHPTNPDVAFVAALGTTWADSEHRGLYRTQDGGKTWAKVLSSDAKSGCCDVVMDPRNPDKLFASLWDHRREPHTFRSGGPGSGLYRSLDGGTTWQKLGEQDGLPGGDYGRQGLAIAASDPRVVYALIECNKNALYRSDDGGFRWQMVNNNDNVAPRPFYFCDIQVDPRDSNRVYNLGMIVELSTDGGRSFRPVASWVTHPDNHSLWIDPQDPDRVLLGNDGGVYQSHDRGETWTFCANLPLAQFYHVAADLDVPYHVYGGLQDNGSWRGPSTVWENGGIRNFHWQEVCFGDGFATMPDPQDSRQGYAMSQGGELVRFDLRTGQQKRIQPLPPEGKKLRFNWNAGIAQDPFDPKTIWFGSQFLHKSTDRGENWTIVSPDLTTDNPEWQKQDESGGITLDATGAENHCTILTIAPSPVQRSVIWVGTDDGRMQVTQDGGTTWRSVEDRIVGLPRNTWCPEIKASKHAAGTAFAVFDGHRRADWKAYVYQTTDFGETWTSLATKDIDGYCLSIEQDPVQPNLLFLGTEFGLYGSIDAGASWFRWKHGIPTASVMGLLIHPRDGDLIVATHGRSIYIVDDITPLRTLTVAMQQEPLRVFPAQDAIAWITKQTPSERFPGHGEFRGETRGRGAFVHVSVSGDDLAHPDDKIERERKAAKAKQKRDAETKETPKSATAETAKSDADKSAEPKAEAKAAEEKPKDKKKEEPKDQVTVEVRDVSGTLVRTFRQAVKLGLNRVVWNLERDGVRGPSRQLDLDDPEVPPPGREVLPGTYELTVRFRGAEQKTKVTVIADPRVDVQARDRIAKDAAQAQQEARSEALRQTLQRLARAKKDIDLVRQRLAVEKKPKEGDDPLKALRDAVEAIDKAMTETVEAIWGPAKPKQGIATPKGLMHELGENAGVLTSTPEAPNGNELLGQERAAAKLAELQKVVETFATGPLTQFAEAVQKSGLGLVPTK
jgi:photosystem II stability/assembly factor-like uncharacterized protein